MMLEFSYLFGDLRNYGSLVCMNKSETSVFYKTVTFPVVAFPPLIFHVVDKSWTYYSEQFLYIRIELNFGIFSNNFFLKCHKNRTAGLEYNLIYFKMNYMFF